MKNNIKTLILAIFLITITGMNCFGQANENLFINGDFEGNNVDGGSGIGTWSKWTSSTTNDTVGVYSVPGYFLSGSQSIAVGHKAGMLTKLNLEPNTNYVLSVYVKAAGSYKPTINIMDVTGSDDRQIGNNNIKIAAGVWTPIQIGFKTPDTTLSTVETQVVLKAWNEGYATYFDLMSLVKGFPDLKTPTVPDTIIASFIDRNEITINWPTVMDSIGDTVQEPYYYKILRSRYPGATPKEISTTSDTFFTDNDIKVVEFYYYGISVVDFMGNESDTTPVLEVFSLPNQWPPSAVELSEATSFKVFPNPASDYLNISGLKIGSQMELITLSGKIFYRNEVDNTEMVIGLEHLSPGVYYIRTTSLNGSTEIQKFIID